MKSQATKTDFNIMIVHFYILRKLDIIRYMIFQCGSESVPIRKAAGIGVFITIVPKVVTHQLWGLLMNVDWLIH